MLGDYMCAAVAPPARPAVTASVGASGRVRAESDARGLKRERVQQRRLVKRKVQELYTATLCCAACEALDHAMKTDTADAKIEATTLPKEFTWSLETRGGTSFVYIVDESAVGAGPEVASPRRFFRPPPPPCAAARAWKKAKGRDAKRRDEKNREGKHDTSEQGSPPVSDVALGPLLRDDKGEAKCGVTTDSLCGGCSGSRAARPVRGAH